MTLSGALRAALEVASRELDVGLQDHLALRQRRRIWAELGPPSEAESTPPFSIGRRRRGALAILCGRYVLPIWEAACPNDRRPHDILQAAHLYLQHQGNEPTLRAMKGRLETHVDNLLSRTEHASDAYAAASAARAASTALHDETFGEGTGEEDTDVDLDPYQWDASFYASMAVSKGAPWDKNTSGGRRRQFWRWYLEQAVPESWENP